jgi:hypothetical protein
VAAATRMANSLPASTFVCLPNSVASCTHLQAGLRLGAAAPKISPPASTAIRLNSLNAS